MQLYIQNMDSDRESKVFELDTKQIEMSTINCYSQFAPEVEHEISYGDETIPLLSSVEQF